VVVVSTTSRVCLSLTPWVRCRRGNVLTKKRGPEHMVDRRRERTVDQTTSRLDVLSGAELRWKRNRNREYPLEQR
jgi:hypothetical protein